MTQTTRDEGELARADKSNVHIDTDYGVRLVGFDAATPIPYWKVQDSWNADRIHQIIPWRERLSGRFRSRTAFGACCPALGPHQMVEAASTTTKWVHHELNETRKRLENIAKELVGNNALMRQVELREKAISHTQRRDQKADHDVTMMNREEMSASGSMRTLLCQKNSLTCANTDLGICFDDIAETLTGTSFVQ